jgi:solute carrier family 8 (sodium/calcium exchanger)
MKLGSETWGQQFRNAMSVNGGDVENATSMDYFMHFITFPWKVCFLTFLFFSLLYGIVSEIALYVLVTGFLGVYRVDFI